MPANLIWKEFRETIWIAAIALVGFLWLVAVSMNAATRNPNTIPFITDNFMGWFVAISGLLAVVLALRQSLGESIFGTFPFLLQKPVSRRTLIAVKLLVGLGLLVVFSSAPILYYGNWAATPGKHASPFQWSMTVLSWLTLATMIGLYLACFLSGLRPARWFGTRLFPAVAALTITCFLLIMPPFYLSMWARVSIVIIEVAVILSCILYVIHTREY